MNKAIRIPAVDLFSGAGGLGEGFHSYRSSGAGFEVRLSIDKDPVALRTLELRSFFRSFSPDEVPEIYYSYVRGEGIDREDLLRSRPQGVESVCNIELGSSDTAQAEADSRIADAISDEALWVLLGGPPCQAYSTVGRARMSRMNRHEFEADHRHFLYREYIRILAEFRPPVFVMENVRGLITARHSGKSMFARILADLSDPEAALEQVDVRPEKRSDGEASYHVYSFTVPRADPRLLSPLDYLVEAERYGIPQSRHRIFLLGIRSDLDFVVPETLEPAPGPTVGEVIGDLPRLRSAVSAPRGPEADPELTKVISSGRPEGKIWTEVVAASFPGDALDDLPLGLEHTVREAMNQLDSSLDTGGQFIRGRPSPSALSDWYVDPRLEGYLNHEARSHMPPDFARYIFVSSFGKKFGQSPSLYDFPENLLPDHSNVAGGTRQKNLKFADRFRVQTVGSPASTIVSHIQKDGHYYIHYDPSQCRSLTVREAARIQTFPDNYFFEGARTEQYGQIGNAVPPLLAMQLAAVVSDVFRQVVSAGDRVPGSIRPAEASHA